MEKIILTEFMRIGDEVEVQVDKESRAYGMWGDLKDGTRGVVVGFYTAINHVTHAQARKRKPGVYHSNGAARIHFADGSGRYMGGHELIFVDPKLKDIRYAEYHSLPQDMRRLETLMAPLPKTNYIEWDVVKIVGGHWKDNAFGGPHDGCPTPAVIRISDIDYRDKEISYSLRGHYADGSTTGTVNVSPGDLNLVERGNLWRHYNGEQPVFNSIEDEVALAEVLGLEDEVRNPVSGDYTWSKEQVLAAIQAGTVDGISVCGGFFGSGPTTRGRRFENRELGERVRAKTLEGFKEELV